MEAETEAIQPLPNVAEVLLRIPLVLEPDHNIVRIPDDDRFALRDIWAPFLVEPQIEHVVQEHVRQSRGHHSPYARGNFRRSRWDHWNRTAIGLLHGAFVPLGLSAE